jgi:hypothetical protein
MRASSLIWSNDGASLFFFMLGTYKDCRAFHSVNVMTRNKNGLITNIAIFQYKIMKLLNAINRTVMPCLMAMDHHGHMLAIFEKELDFVYVYSTSGG